MSRKKKNKKKTKKQGLVLSVAVPCQVTSWYLCTFRLNLIFILKNFRKSGDLVAFKTYNWLKGATLSIYRNLYPYICTSPREGNSFLVVLTKVKKDCKDKFDSGTYH